MVTDFDIHFPLRMRVPAMTLVLIGVLTVAHPSDEKMDNRTNNDAININTPPVKNDAIATERGRDKKLGKLMIPVVVGLKLTTLVTATFTALKIFIVQSLVISKIALLGAFLLALKALYDHLQQKFLHANLAEWQVYPYHAFSLPEWQGDSWAPEYTPYHGDFSTTDLQRLANEHDRVMVPHIYRNKNFSVRSDETRSRPKPPKLPGLGYGTVVAKITETNQD